MAREAGPSTAEAGWARRARAGDARAFGLIVRRYQGPVYRMSCRYLNAAEAEEVTQDTFVRAFTSMARFDPSRPLLPWLATIARRLCLDRLRRQRQDPMEDLAERVADEAPGPEQEASGREMLARMEEELKRLPEGQREALLLFHVEGLAYKDIARVLRVPMGTVMTWIHRGRKKLKSSLATSGEAVPQ
jgi:RNA polymerase sigma-70 factor (ECF subfamily)